MQVLYVLLSPFTRRATDNPIVAFDIKNQEEVVLILYELIISGDNLMQAEECSHSGLRCNYFCHTCKVGSMDAEKKMDKGYSDIFWVYPKLSLIVIG